MISPLSRAPSPSKFVEAFLSPSRGAVIAITVFGLGITGSLVLWGLPLGAVVIAAVTPRISWLRKPATLLFVGAWVIIGTAGVLPRGRLSAFSNVPLLLDVSLAIAGAGAIVALVAVYSIHKSGRARAWVWWAVGVWVVGAGIVVILFDPNTWIDVFALHRDAGQALGAGLSPYSGRSVPNPMEWFPPGSTFGGYTYPPLSVFTFAASDLILGDSRWISVACGPLLVYGIARLSSNATTDYLGLLLLLSPGWPLMVQLAWTETLTITLLVLALTLGVQKRWGIVLFGLYMGSKQYLLLTVPAIVASWFRRHRLRSLVVGGAIAIFAYSVGLLFGFEGYIEWAWRFHLTTPPATLGTDLNNVLREAFGHGFLLPTAVTIPLAMIAGGFVASRKPRSDATLILGSATTLAISFTLGSQAFPNYWYVALATLILAPMVHQRNVLEGAHRDQSQSVPSEESLAR